MAQDLNIKRCWYHGSSKLKHYDIPGRRFEEVTNHPNVEVVRPRRIVEICSGSSREEHRFDMTKTAVRVRNVASKEESMKQREAQIDI